jgi:hypothetical protein
LQLSEDGLHVGYAGLNGDLAQLAGAVAKENTSQSSAFDNELKVARILHVGSAACKGESKWARGEWGSWGEKPSEQYGKPKNWKMLMTERTGKRQI